MKKTMTILLLMVFAFSIASTVMAAEESFKKASVDATRATINYPANAVNESVKVVGKAVYGTAETVISPFKKFWNWATGKGAGQEIITAPINKAGETVKDATVGTAKMPYEAGVKTAEQK
ncbi:MAG: hypothetical protein P9L90_01600 [Candidatus Aadella gelida]|nr:hypothetical protein [Candidatus Aadella gelida]